jgi:DNA end-binding protein Ku
MNMPRAIWSGPISFGLVNIPVSLFPATQSRTVSFRQLHAEDNTPINYTKTCPADQKALTEEDIVKGYEFEKGRFVVMENRDFEAAAASIPKGHAIEIVNFVDLSEIDPIYFQKSYYLAPQETSLGAFRLLLATMQKQNKAAVTRFIFHDKQHMAIVRPEGSALVLETLFYHDEVRSTADLPFADEEIKLKKDELEMAEGLVDRMTRKLDLTAFRDDYRDELLKIIDRKIKGQEITVPKLEPLAPVVDIMDALRKSIARQEEARPRKKKAS